MVPELRRDTMAPQWWSQAYDDLAAAEALLRDRFHAAWVIAYHAQQAGEKFIKAYRLADSGLRTCSTPVVRSTLSEIPRVMRRA
jgi:HEPN domain-containing protein